MKKFSMLFGALSGAVAGYLLSNDKLRKDLANAKDPEAAARALGKHLQSDGKKVAGEMKKFVESDDVQKNLRSAKKFALQKIEEAKKGMKVMVQRGKSAAMSGAAKNGKASSNGNGKMKNGFKEKNV